MAELHQTNQDFLNTIQDADNAPVATPKHLAALLQVVLQQVKEQLREMLNNHTAGVKTEWATLTQLAKIFGVSRRTLDRIMPELMRKHKIDMIQMTDYLGSKGHRRFRIADVEQAFLEEQAAA